MPIKKGKKTQYSVGLTREASDMVEAFMNEECIEIQNIAFEKIVSHYFRIRDALDTRWDNFQAGYLFGRVCPEASKKMIDDAYFQFQKLELISKWILFLNENFSEKKKGIKNAIRKSI